MSIRLPLLILIGLLFTAHPARANENLNVAVSIKPVHSLISALMAGAGEPSLIVKGNRSPHTYSLKPSDARQLSNADLVIWVGPGLELFLEKPLKSLSTKATILTLETDPEADPHLWLSPVLAENIVNRALEKLVRIDPAHGSLYEKNAIDIRKRLTRLHQSGKARLMPLKQTPFLVFHDAWGHFAASFGISIAGTVALNPERPPAAKRLSEIRQTLREEDIKCLFKEPQFSSPFLSNLLEGFSDIQVMELDPLGSAFATGPEAYFSMMEANIQAVTTCLRAGN